MPRIDGFIYSSDFDTLKNDDSGTGQVTVPGGATVAASTLGQWSTNVDVGQAEALLNVRVKNNVQGNKWYVAGMNLSFARSGTIPGPVVVGYNVIVNVAHTDSDTVRLLAVVQNPYGSTLTLSATSDIFDFSLRTYLAPDFD